MALKDLATVIAVLVGLVSLAYAAYNTRLNLKVNRARFWLDLRDCFARHDETHRKLRPGSPWSGPAATGPSTPDEWAQVEAYMGLFEHCEQMLRERLIDADTFTRIYRYRLDNLLANPIIVRAKLIERRSGWTTFLDLLQRFNLNLPQA